MSEYKPDRWVILEIDGPKFGKIQKILAGWYGGYVGGDSWKLSSGNESRIDHGDYFEYPQSSGSTYICRKGSYAMSSYTYSIYLGFLRDVEKMNNGTTLRLLGEEEAMK